MATTMITDQTWGWCYLLHFSRPLGNLENTHGQAQHYTGWALDPEGSGAGLQQRIAQHQAGQGACITRAAIEQGIDLVLVATWRAPLAFEKALKRKKSGPSLCPLCATGIAIPTPAQPWPEGFEFPPPPPRRMDWEEISYYRRQRAMRQPQAIRENWDEGLL